MVTLDDLHLDIQAVMEKRRPVPEQLAGFGAGHLRGLTEEIYARLDEATAGAEDVAFIPDDPHAAEGEPGWNLAHVVVHLTAGLEENAAQASTLARGVEIHGPAALRDGLGDDHDRGAGPAAAGGEPADHVRLPRHVAGRAAPGRDV
jgi:hypothetical protein